MSRSLLPFLFLLLTLTACTSSRDRLHRNSPIGSGPQLTETALELGAGSVWHLRHPVSWKYTFLDAAAPEYLAIRFEGTGRFGPVLRITALGYTQGLTDSNVELIPMVEKLVIDSSQRFIPKSVEGEIIIQHLPLESGAAAYATFTDSTLIGKKPKKGDFLTATSGAMIRDGWTIAFSFFDYQLSPSRVAQALDVVQSVIPPTRYQAQK